MKFLPGGRHAATCLTLIGLFGWGITADEMVQPRRLIDCHTAGLLPRAYYDLEMRTYPARQPSVDGAGMTFFMSVGITNRFMMGAGYGADGLIGRKGVKGNPWPGILVKYRLVEESFHFPGMAIGFDWQGFGGIEGYVDTENCYRGYVYKSQGAFFSISKNYLLLSTLTLGFHGAVNYSLEEHIRVKWPNGYMGLDLGVNEEFALGVEYDMALNQEDPDRSTYANPFRGFLNLGVRWAFSPSFYIEAAAKDVLENKLHTRNVPGVRDRRLGWTRELKLVYLDSF